jgi:hypothetical protein
MTNGARGSMMVLAAASRCELKRNVYVYGALRRVYHRAKYGSAHPGSSRRLAARARDCGGKCDHPDRMTERGQHTRSLPLRTLILSECRPSGPCIPSVWRATIQPPESVPAQERLSATLGVPQGRLYLRHDNPGGATAESYPL